MEGQAGINNSEHSGFLVIRTVMPKADDYLQQIHNVFQKDIVWSSEQSKLATGNLEATQTDFLFW